MTSTNLTHFSKEQSKDGQEASGEDKVSHDCKELILSLPRENGWTTPHCYLFQNFWCQSNVFQPIITFQKHFQAKDSDIIIATLPKSGTTWIKALTFAIVNRQHFSSLENHPLLLFNPHELVPFFELSIYGNFHDQIPKSHMSNMTESRIFGIHIPFPSLAKSIKECNCRIIYMCRNPFDNFESTWNVVSKIKPKSIPSLTIKEAFERYCKGISAFGPFWNHMLGYMNESILRPDKILFMKYEELKEDFNFHVKKVAEFLGCPFTPEEESSGVIKNIIKLCSFEKMKELEVNKYETLGKNIEKKYFSQKAEIGDWVNYLTPLMVEKLSKIIEEKFSGSDLSFKMFS